MALTLIVILAGLADAVANHVYFHSATLGLIALVLLGAGIFRVIRRRRNRPAEAC